MGNDNSQPIEANTGKSDPMRYSAHKSRIAQEIRAREELEERRKKHAK